VPAERPVVTIQALEKEHSSLDIRLQARILTTEQIRTIQAFAAQMAKGLIAIDREDGFVLRQQILDELQFQAILPTEDDVRIAYACCMLGEEVLHIASSNDRRCTGARIFYRDRPKSATGTSDLDACLYSGWAWVDRRQTPRAWP